ncbi:unnamed protein product [Effrenium voratum]|uniref:CSC1/OSCA1-like 7TM region domain-containing protein n=1 Tax=Effrenium voratum TaxID=2562239 RepID=A0AA36J6Z0_9DINO|nr:unnamed protein product [Effrenium voratum]
MQTIYDTAQIWTAGSPFTPHLLQDDTKDCSANAPPASVYRSPSCTQNVSAPLIYRFQQSKGVKCLRVAAKGDQGEGPPKPMRIYACNSSSLVVNSSGYFDTNGDVWSKDTYCLRFDDAILQGYNFPQPVKMRSDCLFPVTLEAAQLAVAQGESFSNSQRIECFCAQQTALEPFLRIPGYLDTPQAKVCEEWAWFQGTQMGVRAGGVIAVMVINNVLLIIFAYFDSLGRYQTATDLAASQVFNLFFATLVNTAVVYLLIGMNVYTSDNSFFGALKFGQGPFDDLTPLWFVTIGNMLVITILCQIACSVALPVLWVWTVDPLIRWFFCKDTHSQELLNEYHLLPEWTLSLRVAETLVVVFCVFMYSSGFPVLYLCGALYCLFAYWADKYALLRGSRKPPGYTKSAIESAVAMMPFAVLLHLVFGLWLFGSQELMPSEWGGLRVFMTGLVGMATDFYEEVRSIISKGGFDVRGANYSTYIQARMVDCARAAAEPSMWLFCGMVIWYGLLLLHWIFRPCIGNCVGDLTEKILKGLKIHRDAEVTKITLSQAKEREDLKGLLSYRLSANPNYEEAMMALKFHPEGPAEEGQVGKRLSGTKRSLSKLEESLERTVAQKVHEAENFVAHAIDKSLAAATRRQWMRATRALLPQGKMSGL